MNFLDDEERIKLRKQHRQERDGRIRDRIKAILLYDGGWSPKQISEALLISDEAARNHIDEYKTLNKLKPQSGGSEEKLSDIKGSKIILHFLPPYSPNLNPIERLWKWMKERVIYNSYYPGFEEFQSAIFGFFVLLSSLAADSELGKNFRSRVRDKFRPIRAPAANF